MKNFAFRAAWTAAFFTVPLLLGAENFQSGGLWFDSTAGTAGCVVVAPPVGAAPYAGSITVPAEVVYEGKTLPVVGIAQSAFAGSQELVSVSIPDNVASIGDYAFQNCTSLSSISLPKNLSEIPDYMCAGCRSLTEIGLTGNLRKIGDYAFADCTLLRNYSADPYLYVMEFGDGCFLNCSSLEAAFQISPCTEVGNYAFSGCTALKDLKLFAEVDYSVNLRDRVAGLPYECEVDDYAFKGCSSLTSVFFQYVNTDFGEGVFQDCTSLKTVFSDSDTGFRKIPDMMFRDCPSLVELEVKGIEEVGNHAFANCSSLKEFKFNTLREVGEGAFSGCSALEVVMIPAAVTEIEPFAFYRCSSILYMYTGDNVESIGESAFEGCSAMKHVSMTQAMKNIDINAFKDCAAMENVYVNSNYPPLLNPYAFSTATYLNASLDVPKGMRAIFSQSSNWSNFKNVKETDRFPGFNESGICAVNGDNPNLKAYRAGQTLRLEGDIDSVRVVTIEGIVLFDGPVSGSAELTVHSLPLIVVTPEGTLKL